MVDELPLRPEYRYALVNTQSSQLNQIARATTLILPSLDAAVDVMLDGCDGRFYWSLIVIPV